MSQKQQLFTDAISSIKVALLHLENSNHGMDGASVRTALTYIIKANTFCQHLERLHVGVPDAPLTP